MKENLLLCPLMRIKIMCLTKKVPEIMDFKTDK